MPLADQILGLRTTNPYTIQRNADATIELYGSNGNSPTSLSFVIASIVGHGAVNKKMEANGAIVEHASTMIGPTVAASTEDDDPAAAADPAAALAATLENVDKTMGVGMDDDDDDAVAMEDAKEDNTVGARDGVSMAGLH